MLKITNDDVSANEKTFDNMSLKSKKQTKIQTLIENKEKTIREMVDIKNNKFKIDTLDGDPSLLNMID